MKDDEGKTEGLFKLRCVLQRLCKEDQFQELQLIRNAMSLHKAEEEKGDVGDKEFKQFLTWVILENNSIVENSFDYFKRDYPILKSFEAQQTSELNNILLNYYYEPIRELWEFFAEEEVEDAPINWEKLFDVLKGSIPKEESVDGYQPPFSYVMQNLTSTGEENKWEPRPEPFSDNPIFPSVNQNHGESVYKARMPVPSRDVHFIFLLDKDFSKALLWYKLLLPLEKSRHDEHAKNYPNSITPDSSDG